MRIQNLWIHILLNFFFCFLSLKTQIIENTTQTRKEIVIKVKISYQKLFESFTNIVHIEVEAAARSIKITQRERFFCLFDSDCVRSISGTVIPVSIPIHSIRVNDSRK